MNTSGIRVGDLVEVDKRGRLFYAEVVERENGRMKIDPITHNINYFEVKSTEIKTHFKRMGRTRA